MIILLFLNLVFASEWTTIEMYPSSWGSKQICEQLGKSECFEIQESTSRYSKNTIQVDDLSKPIWEAESNLQYCADEQSCFKDLESFSCPSGKEKIYSKVPTHRLYCTLLLGYQKKNKTILEVDPTLDLAYQSSKQAKTVEAVKEQMVQAKLADIQKGQKIIAIMRVGSDSKNLTKQQKKTLINTTKEVIEALNIGSLDVAKELIEGIAPDGTLITNEDKAKILGLL